MEGKDHDRRQDVFSKPVRAGKRTYFFDVKATRANDYYLTITESKRRIDESGKFSYDKHKLFLYREDFKKFSEGLREVIEYVESEKGEMEERIVPTDDHADARSDSDNSSSSSYTSDISFDDLENEDKD